MAKKKTFPTEKPWLKKAYNNLEYLNSPSARYVRVLSEFMEPEHRLGEHNIKDTIVFFGSSRITSRKKAREMLKAAERALGKKKNPSRKLKKAYEKAKHAVATSHYYEDAVKLSEKMTKWSMGIPGQYHRFAICSGGGPGIMEAANLGAKKAGGKSIGLNVSIPIAQEPNEYQTKDLAFMFHYFFIRKFWLVYMSKALVIFPGGYGTLDELFEILTLLQTQKIRRPIPIIIYGPEYWRDLINFDTLVKWDMIEKKHLNLFAFFDDVDKAFRYLKRELTKHYLK